MGYFINPVNYDDRENVNVINFVNNSSDSIIVGIDNIVNMICSEYEKGLILIDGYLTTDIAKLANQLNKVIKADRILEIDTFYQSSEKIKEMISDSLPDNKEYDPRLIYGKLYPGQINEFVDSTKVSEFMNDFEKSRKTIIFGHGCLSEMFSSLNAKRVFIDMTPKDAALRINHNDYVNIGNKDKIGFDETARRAYFVDVELITKIRRNAIKRGYIDYYLLENFEEKFTYVEKEKLEELLEISTQQPMRPKPFYIEGVWGGQFIKKLRHIPDDVVEKISWSFELIATEASVAYEIDSYYLDIPFLTIMDVVGENLIGEENYSRFDGYFPIRFNFDDTWHSDGNMSIQCHPNDEMASLIHGDFAGQNEAYYVLNTGHDARTYLGFNSGVKGEEFLQLCKRSESTGEMVPYRDYVNSLQSRPGMQVLIPAGTVHGSGRNQIVLELGSLTINAYTYKIYDYNRKGLDGRPRPIHSKYAEQALVFSRDEEWVKSNVAFEPVLLDEQDDFQEYLIGRYDSIYFETHKINIITGGVYQGENDKGFCVLTLVDGEKVEIRSKENPHYKYCAYYLDVVVIPSGIKNYIVEAKGKQPVVIHKAFVR